MIGNIIGSGIFRLPSAVAVDTGSISGVAMVWLMGGLIAICGTLSLAELAAAFPQAGGAFVYLREAFGPGMAFLFGWTMLVVGPAASGAIALVFAEYLGTLVPLSANGVRLVAATAILVVSAAGYRSVRGAGAIQGVAAVAKVGALLLLVAAAFLLDDGSVGAFGRGAPLHSDTNWRGLGLGLVAVLWAYGGAQDVLYIAGEVRDPTRILPRALTVGIATVVIVYLSANAAYLHVLPFSTLRASPLVASDVAVRVLGAAGAGMVSGAVAVSAFGALNGLVLTNSRVFYAMAADGLLFRRLADVDPRFGTPHVALTCYGLVSVSFVWSRSFEQLAESFVLGVWPFLALAVAGMMVLRRTRPELTRPYRTPFYPAVPLVYITGVAGVVANALVARPASALLGVGLTLAGIPVYLIWRRMAMPNGTRGPALTPRG